MQGKNHVALALAAPLALAAVSADPGILPGSAGAWTGLIVGSLAPDIDGGGSVVYLGSMLPRAITPKPVRALLNGLGRTVSDVIRAIVGHRNALHWPLIGLILTWLGWQMGLGWLAWLGIGYILHILGDALTISGVPLFGPVYRRDISFFPMRTGRFLERAFGVVLWLFVGWRLAVVYVPRAAWVFDILYRFGSGLL